MIERSISNRIEYRNDKGHYKDIKLEEVHEYSESYEDSRYYINIGDEVVRLELTQYDKLKQLLEE